MTLHARFSLVSLALLPACFAPHDPVIVTDGDSSGNADSDSSGTPTSSATTSTTATTDDVTSTSNDATDPSTTTEADSSSGGPGAVCGNAEIEDGEACDDGTNDGSYGGCAPDCTELGPYCGDTHVNGDEACDDGNDENADGCNIDCIVSGTVLWQLEYDGAAGTSDQGKGIAADGAGNVIVVGQEGTNGEPQGWIRAFDPDGNVGWTQLHGSAAGDVSYDDVAVDPDDDIAAAGFGEASGQGYNALVRKYDSNGGDLWTDAYDTNDAVDQAAHGVAADQEGYFAEIGSDDGTILVRRLHPDGGEMWRRNVSGTATAYGTKVAIDGEGNVLAFGTISQPDGNRAWLRKYDPNGGTTWTRIAEDGITAARDVAVDSDGNVVFTANGLGVRKLDADGNELWTFEGDAEGLDLGLFYAVTTDSSGAVIVTGVGGPVSTDITLVKFDADGNSLWGRYLTEDSNFSVGNGVAVDSSDNILVVGTSNFGNTNDIFVAKLAP